jgi:lysophospholipase L1-like esterase
MRSFGAVVISFLAVACAGAPAPKPVHTAAVPAPRDANWLPRHEAIVEKAKAGGHRLVFVGDSITAGWGGAGKEAWQEHWAPRAALNAGIGGDRTQHVAWRLDNGLAAALAAPNNDVRACVVMIGTNNSNGSDHTAEQIADGIIAVVERLRAALPNAKVLLLAIFPRGEQPNAQRDKNAAASKLAFAACASDPMVVCRDIGERFLGEGGTLAKDVMPDRLHLSAAAYSTWAQAIVADVDAMLR